MKSALAGCAAILLTVYSPVLAENARDPVAAAAPSTIGAAPAAAAPAEGRSNPAVPGSSGDADGAVGALASTVAAEQAVPPPPPPVTLVLSADLGLQRLTVLEKGTVKHVWPISSGRRGYATRTGTFRPQWMTRMWYSRQYEWSPMPHAVFFNRGTAFHATRAVGLLGRPASHGCIRLAPANAALLFALVRSHGLTQTKVVVHGAPKEPAVARRSPARGQLAGRQPAYGAYYGAYQAGGALQGSRVSRYAPPGAAFWPF